MSRVDVNLSLDIPGADKISEAELRQALFDGLFNYATSCHLRDVLAWMDRKGLDGTDGVGHDRLIRIHQTWADICESAKWEIAPKPKRRKSAVTPKPRRKDTINQRNRRG